MSIKKRNQKLGQEILSLEMAIMKRSMVVSELKKRRNEKLKELLEEEEKEEPTTLHDFPSDEASKKTKEPKKGQKKLPEANKKGAIEPPKPKRTRGKGKAKAKGVDEEEKALLDTHVPKEDD